jgi:hypothetical protein
LATVSEHAVVPQLASIDRGKERSLRLFVLDKQPQPMGDNPNQQGCAVSQSTDQEIAAMRLEIEDLEKAIARQDPPLAPHTRVIAEAKIATLQSQIAAMKGESGRQPAQPE